MNLNDLKIKRFSSVYDVINQLHVYKSETLIFFSFYHKTYACYDIELKHLTTYRWQLDEERLYLISVIHDIEILTFDVSEDRY